MAMLGVSTADEDDDGNKASYNTPPKNNSRFESNQPANKPQPSKPPLKTPVDATQKAKDDLAKIQTNKQANLDKKEDRELKERVDNEIKDEIKAMLSALTQGMAMKEKGNYVVTTLGCTWTEIDKMKNADLLDVEAKLLTIFKTR